MWVYKTWSELGSSAVKSVFKRHVKADDESEPTRDELVERLQNLLLVNEVMREKVDVVADMLFQSDDLKIKFSPTEPNSI